MKVRIFYRVVPQWGGYASENFEIESEAQERAKERNKIRVAEWQSCPEKYTEIYLGHNCIIEKVTEISEQIKL